MITSMEKDHLLTYDSKLRAGKYRINTSIGQGGFGITYMATDIPEDRVVAIKELYVQGYCLRTPDTHEIHVQTGKDSPYPEFKVRFQKEAEQLANVHHDNIVKVLDYFEENNTAYMVMEFIEGPNLSGYLRLHKYLSHEEALSYILQLNDALTYLHQRNMYHRDIKPSNIMLRERDATAILIDFGNAKEFITHQNVTMTNSRILSPGFAPLEQYSNRGKLGGYSEVYSLGACLYFMLTGQIPVDAAARAGGEPLEFPDYAQLNSYQKEVIEQSLAVLAKDRYQTVAEFSNALKAAFPIRRDTIESIVIPPVEEQFEPEPHQVLDQPSHEEEPVDIPELEPEVYHEHAPTPEYNYSNYGHPNFDDIFYYMGTISEDQDEAFWEVRLRDATKPGKKVFRLLVFPKREREFRDLYQKEFNYYTYKGQTISALSEYDKGLGYYRGYFPSPNLRDYWNSLYPNFIKGNKLNKAGELLIVSIWKEAAVLQQNDLFHGDIRAENILIEEKQGTINVTFVNFPMLKDFDMEQRLDESLRNLIGEPYIRFLDKLQKKR